MSDEESKKFLDSIEKLIDVRVNATLSSKLMLTVEECSHFIGVSQSKLRDLIRDNQIPVVRIKEEGAKQPMVRIPVEALRLWVKEHTVKAG